MSTRNIEKLLHPGTFNWVGNAFYTTSFIGKGNISHRRMDTFLRLVTMQILILKQKKFQEVLVRIHTKVSKR